MVGVGPWTLSRVAVEGRWGTVPLLRVGHPARQRHQPRAPTTTAIEATAVIPVLRLACVQAIQRANATNYGLAAAVWTQSIERMQACTRGMKAGTVWVNTHHVMVGARGGEQQMGGAHVRQDAPRGG